MRAARQPSREQIALSDVLHALSDPARIEVIVGIADVGEQPCNHICLDMPKSSLSHHLKVLRESGVISTRINGTRHFNSIRNEDLDARFPGLMKAILKAARNAP